MNRIYWFTELMADRLIAVTRVLISRLERLCSFCPAVAKPERERAAALLSSYILLIPTRTLGIPGEKGKAGV